VYILGNIGKLQTPPFLSDLPISFKYYNVDSSDLASDSAIFENFQTAETDQYTTQ